MSDAALRQRAHLLLARDAGFGACSAALREQLVAAGSVVRHPKGACVSRRGERVDALGLVLAGSFELCFNQADGRRHLAGLLQPGGIFGMVALLDGQGQLNDLWARNEGALLMVPGTQVRALRDREPALVAALEGHVARRLRDVYERLSAEGEPVELRLARLLRRFARQYGVRRGEGALLDLKLSQVDLADLLAVSRQRVNAGLRELVAAGLIGMRYSTVEIQDLRRFDAFLQAGSGDR